MVKLNGIVLAPMAVFCGIVSAARLYMTESDWRHGGDAFNANDAPTQVADVWGHAFNVTVDYVNIRGFAATIATGKWWVML